MNEEWIAIAETVTGAQHIKVGKPNQDAILALSKSPIWIVAVADGHGSQKSPRSAKGAELAVKIATLHIYSILSKEGTATIEKEQLTRISETIVKQWQDEVIKDSIENEWSDEEKTTIKNQKDFLLYGTTLLVCAITETQLLFLQIGDGDIIIVENNNNIISPIARDPNLIANETTSLGMKDAQKSIRSAILPLEGEKPNLIMLSTDGYSNSFVDPEGFIQAATDIATMLNEKGSTPIRKDLKNWLQSTSAEGSGDDTTVGLLWHPGSTK